MTDKQIIIDGVDVSGCEWYKQGATGFICADYNKSNDCSKNPNCYYKQLKRKEQECEELKKQIKIIDDETIVVEITEKQFEEYQKLKQALTEIKEIAETCNSGVSCSACPYTKECRTDLEAEALGVCKMVLKKCEVLDDICTNKG